MTRRIRLYRRQWRHDGRVYQVMALRLADPTRYAVALDDRWTLVSSDLAGVRLLGRLLWGLSYQRRPDTLLVLDPGRMAADPDRCVAAYPAATVTASPAAVTVLAVPDRPTEPALIDERVRAPAEVVAARRPGPWDPAPAMTC